MLGLFVLEVEAIAEQDQNPSHKLPLVGEAGRIISGLLTIRPESIPALSDKRPASPSPRLSGRRSMLIGGKGSSDIKICRCLSCADLLIDVSLRQSKTLGEMNHSVYRAFTCVHLALPGSAKNNLQVPYVFQMSGTQRAG